MDYFIEHFYVYSIPPIVFISMHWQQCIVNLYHNSSEILIPLDIVLCNYHISCSSIWQNWSHFKNFLKDKGLGHQTPIHHFAFTESTSIFRHVSVNLKNWSDHYTMYYKMHSLKNNYFTSNTFGLQVDAISIIHFTCY